MARHGTTRHDTTRAVHKAASFNLDDANAKRWTGGHDWKTVYN